MKTFIYKSTDSFLRKLLSAIFLILIGICFFIFPFTSVRLLGMLAGIGAILYAVGRIAILIRLCAKENLPPLFIGEFSLSVLIAAAGLLLIFRTDATLSFFAFLAGVYLMAQAVIHLFRLMFFGASGAARDSVFWVTLVASSLALAMGIFLTFFPTQALRIAAIPLGILTELDGVSDLYTALRSRKKKHTEEEKSTYIETDFRDKTDEE